MRPRYLAALAGFVLWLAGPAMADRELAVQSPEPGTVFVFNDARVERFVRIEGESQVWATRRGREYVRSPNPAEPILEWALQGSRGKRTIIGNPGKLWPPAPGKSARFRVLTVISEDGRERRSIQNWSCKIARAQNVSVPAGSYSALPLTCTRYSVNSMRPLEKRTWWYTPDVAHYVKRRYQDMRNGRTSEYRLCAALPERRATDARINALARDGC